MFTGIIEEVGSIASLEAGEAGARVVVQAPTITTGLPIGGSVAVNGCCLTAVEITAGAFAADLSPETLQRTNLGDLQAGSEVNLEQPLLPTSRLSGHFVQGHVDGTGEFLGLDELGDGNWWLRVRLPEDLTKYFVMKGSIAIDGISLTIAELRGAELAVAVIPHTYQETNLRAKKSGDRVNIECDVLAKYVERLIGQMGGAGSG